MISHSGQKCDFSPFNSKSCLNIGKTLRYIVISVSKSGHQVDVKSLIIPSSVVVL